MNQDEWRAARMRAIQEGVKHRREADEQQVLRDLDFDLICQMRFRFGLSVREGRCGEKAILWIECTVCGAQGLACMAHATRMSALTPVSCWACRHEKPAARELFLIALLPAEVI